MAEIPGPEQQAFARSKKEAKHELQQDEAFKTAKRKRLKDLKQRLAKFSRGQRVPVKSVKDKRLKGQLRHTERLAADATQAAAKADEWLLPEAPGGLEAEGMERTWRFSQEDIAREAEVGAAAKAFDLHLPHLGPYRISFTRSGRFLLLAGRKGHLAMVDWQRAHIVTELQGAQLSATKRCLDWIYSASHWVAGELQVKETVRDITFLHNETFFAAAQRKYVYIYDKRGIEIHCLRDHLRAKRLGFLPHHFLLASIGEAGVLRYQDTSTGHLIAQISTRHGTCDVMSQNPWNACLALGHPNGVVTMWTPNTGKPLLSMLCHHGPVRSLAFDRTGHHMVTSGVDGSFKVFDVRTYKMLHRYTSRGASTCLDVSQRGMFASTVGRTVQVWKDGLERKAFAPYMNHAAPAAVRSLAFCPYEDVLAIGHAEGVSTMLVPGAGEPNFDSRVADPFQRTHARQQQEVAQLLDKLQPDMIVLDPTQIGQVRKEPQEVQQERAALAKEASAGRRKAQREKNDAKTKMKGKNKPSRQFKKKQTNIVEERRDEIRARAKEDEAINKERNQKEAPKSAPRALRRFYRSK